MYILIQTHKHTHTCFDMCKALSLYIYKYTPRKPACKSPFCYVFSRSIATLNPSAPNQLAIPVRVGYA